MTNRINFPDVAGQRFGRTELKWLQDSLIADICARAIRTASPGIIANSDPKVAGSPLTVTVDDVAQQFVVSPGALLMDDGSLLLSPTELRLAIPTDGRDYLVVIQPVDEFFNAAVTMGEETIQSLVRTNPHVLLVAVAQYASYSNNAEFLAYYSAGDGLSLTHETITLRRWSSVADWVHRGKKGSGVVTDSNPHGTGIFDMALNETTPFWKAFDSDGLVVAATAEGMPYVRGTLVREIINPGQWTEGGNNTHHALLRYAPMYVTAAKLNAATPRALPIVTVGYGAYPTDEQNLQWKRVITVAASAQPTVPVEVVYFVASSLNFFVSASDRFELNSLDTNEGEVMVVNGQNLPLATRYSFALADRRDYPSHYEVRVSQANGVYLWPRLVVKSVELADLSAVTTYNTQLTQAGKLRLRLGNTQYHDDLSVQIKVIGLNAAGASVNETVTFTADWDNDEDANYVDTANSYSQLISLQVISANADVVSTLQVQALGDANFASIGKFLLESGGISYYQDLRDISITPLVEPQRGERDLVWSMDFSNQYWTDPYDGKLYSSDPYDLLNLPTDLPEQLPSRYLKGTFLSAPLKLRPFGDDNYVGDYNLLVRLDADGPIGPDVQVSAGNAFYNSRNFTLGSIYRISSTEWILSGITDYTATNQPESLVLGIAATESKIKGVRIYVADVSVPV